MTSFSWPGYPTTQREFESLMVAIDARLQEEELQPFQRPLSVCRLLGDAFKWAGNILPPKSLADLPGFTGEILMAKAHRWYETVYGDRLKSDWALGYVPASIGNALWKARVPVFYGQCHLFIDRNLSNQGTNGLEGKGHASANILALVEHLRPDLAIRVPESDLTQFWDFYISALQSFVWREELHGNDLFTQAVHDYSASTEDLLNRRYAQSRWSSAQAVEKTLKGLLSLAKTPYPTRGWKGHDLVHLGELLDKHHGIAIEQTLLKLATCTSEVRYGDEPSSEKQALLANHALLGVLEQLRQNSKTPRLLARQSYAIREQ